MPDLGGGGEFANTGDAQNIPNYYATNNLLPLLDIPITAACHIQEPQGEVKRTGGGDAIRESPKWVAGNRIR